MLFTTLIIFVLHLNLFGYPSRLIRDRARHTHFLFEVAKELYGTFKIHTITTASYNPQAIGVIESRHKDMNKLLRRLAEEYKTNWDTRLTMAFLALRETVPSTTKVSPFKAMFHRSSFSACFQRYLICLSLLQACSWGFIVEGFP